MLEVVTAQPVADLALPVAHFEPVAVEGKQSAHAVNLGLGCPRIRVGNRGLHGASAIVTDELGHKLGDHSES
jgi:hypothetical protein